jgi:hypothetical protein
VLLPNEEDSRGSWQFRTISVLALLVRGSCAPGVEIERVRMVAVSLLGVFETTGDDRLYAPKGVVFLGPAGELDIVLLTRV